eukprot:3773664-Heterocapsa_arctica.AAC.1
MSRSTDVVAKPGPTGRPGNVGVGKSGWLSVFTVVEVGIRLWQEQLEEDMVEKAVRDDKDDVRQEEGRTRTSRTT